MKRSRALFLLVPLVWALLAACAGGPRGPYPPPPELEQALEQRQAFVAAFLQGKWCEAAYLFQASEENYLLQDDFCAVSENHLLAWKLKGYLGLDDPALLERAREFRELGMGCPGNPAPPGTERGGGARDQAWRALLDAGDFPALEDALASEEDPLFASVYGRKAARAAMDAGDEAAARSLLERTRALDAAHGWVVFVLEDWKLLASLAGPDERARIARRMQMLEELIQPCSFD